MCKCGVDHENATATELAAGEDHLGSLPRGRTYFSRTGRAIFAYAPASAPAKCRRRNCACETPEDRAECTCVSVRIEAGHGARAYSMLPYGYPVRAEVIT